MKAEYKYLLLFAAWMAVWLTFPLLAFVLMVACLVKTFWGLRQQRLAQERQRAALASPRMREWMRMEGFDVPEVEDKLYYRKG